jgi:hypothetical protein
MWAAPHAGSLRVHLGVRFEQSKRERRGVKAVLPRNDFERRGVGHFIALRRATMWHAAHWSIAISLAMTPPAQQGRLRSNRSVWWIDMGQCEKAGPII